MTSVMQALAQFFLYAVMALFAQNAVFTRALGVSRLVKIVGDGTDPWSFGLLLCCIQLLAAPMGYVANNLLQDFDYQVYVRPLAMLVCAAVAFFIVLGVLILARKVEGAANLVGALPMATFNTCVLGTMLISATQHFTFGQTMGFALGSGVGYVLAIQVVLEGQRKLDSERVPAMFRGLPVALLYIGILALAIYGFTGHTVSF